MRDVLRGQGHTCDFSDQEKAVTCGVVNGVRNLPRRQDVVVIRKADNREMHFPDTGVIIPCSIKREETKLTTISHVYSA